MPYFFVFFHVGSVDAQVFTYSVILVLTCAIPVTDNGTPCMVYTFGEDTFNVITFSDNL